MLEKGVFAVFATQSSRSATAMRAFARTFHMPYVTPSLAHNHTGQKTGYEIYMRPYYMRAFLDMAKHYRWERVVYVYDSDTGTEVREYMAPILFQVLISR